MQFISHAIFVAFYFGNAVDAFGYIPSKVSYATASPQSDLIANSNKLDLLRNGITSWATSSSSLAKQDYMRMLGNYFMILIKGCSPSSRDLSDAS